MEKGMETATRGFPLLWMLSSYGDLITGFRRRRREAASLAGRLPHLEADPPVPDSRTIFRWIEELCSTPHRRPGTPEGHQGEQYVAGQLEESGVVNV